jgi:ribose 5-phosphate isomerase A
MTNPLPAPTNLEAYKRAAAAGALDYVKDGMKIGLGTGSTAEAFLELLAEKVRGGLKIIGTPTSQRTADRARALGITIEDLDVLGTLDLVVDGADEADHDFNLIKGGGGALLREKIVANSAPQMVVIADETKLVNRLGAFDLPIEVISFGHGSTAARIVSASNELGYSNLIPKLRMKDDTPFKTDNGNYIYDCSYGVINDSKTLADTLSCITGVAEHGLFVGIATSLIIAGVQGVRITNRKFDNG